MLDLDAIRARNHGFLCTLGKCTAPAVALEPGEEWAYRCKEHASESATPGRALEAQQHVAALLNEVERLKSNTCPHLILDDPEGIIGMVDATSEAEAWAAFQAENPGDYDGDPDDHDVVIECVSIRWCDQVVDDLSKARYEVASLKAENERLRAMVPRLDRLTAELAAAQAELSAARRGPVVEWYPTTVGEAARLGMFWLSVGPGGWTLRIRLPFGLGIGDLVESGPETGPEGKSAAVAAWQRACGVP